MLTRLRNLLTADTDTDETDGVDAEAITIQRMVEIVRTHGLDNLNVEVLATVPASEADTAFRDLCKAARRMDLPGRISTRPVAA